MATSTNTFALTAVTAYPTSVSVTTNLSPIIPSTVIPPNRDPAIRGAIFDYEETWYLIQLPKAAVCAPPSETVTITEGLNRTVTKVRALPAETVSITESPAVARRVAKTRTLSETKTIGEGLTRQTAKIRVVPAQTVTVGESVTRTKTKVKSLTENVTIAESVTRQAGKIRNRWMR